jgi:hypothetical protein
LENVDMNVPFRPFVLLLAFGIVLSVMSLGPSSKGTASPILAAPASRPALDTPAIRMANSRAPLAVVELAIGAAHTCARFSNGTAKCWGWNGVGQLGLGDTDHRGDGANEMGDALPFLNVGLGRTVAQLTAGDNHTCARLDNNSVKCWGWNTLGQLGLEDTVGRGDNGNEMGDQLPTVNLGAGRTAVEIVAGGAHTCARLDNNVVKCWGSNGFGQLGQGNTTTRGDNAGEMGDALVAVDFGAVHTAVSLAAGDNHTCARLENDAVKCWGRNDLGQLGLGNTTNRGDNGGEMGDSLPAVSLGMGRTAVELIAGQYHTCARLDDGGVKCWGRNDFGQLGLGNTANRGDNANEMGAFLPVVSLGAAFNAVELSAGVFHSCARFANGTVKCWGRNDLGQLGLGHTFDRGDDANEMGDALPTIDLGTGRTAAKLTGSGPHTCARLDDGRVKCWGYNLFGQLGLGNTDNRGDGPDEMGDNLPPVDLGNVPSAGDPCPGPAPITLAHAGANGYVYCGANNLLTGNLRAPGAVHDSVTAIFWWNNVNQQFNFWFRGFPDSFQTLTSLEAGNYYFFQTTTTGGEIGNTGGSATLAAPGSTAFGTVAGANGWIWSGSAHPTNTLGADPGIIAVTAIFSWNNTSQQFNFWFRGFPDSFQTVAPGIERGKYYFFQAPAGHTIPMD